MVLASHVIFTAYGFWLPNDPRGSWSDFVRSWELLRFGKATKVDHHHSVASRPHDVVKRRAAKEALKYPLVEFTGAQALSIGKGFRRAIAESEYPVLACAILPLHVHMVIARHVRYAERIVGHLKARATVQLRADGLHPFERFAAPDGSVPCAWARKCWKRFRDTAGGVRQAIEYVEGNPATEDKPRQHWSFVVPYQT